MASFVEEFEVAEQMVVALVGVGVLVVVSIEEELDDGTASGGEEELLLLGGGDDGDAMDARFLLRALVRGQPARADVEEALEAVVLALRLQLDHLASVVGHPHVSVAQEVEEDGEPLSAAINQDPTFCVRQNLHSTAEHSSQHAVLLGECGDGLYSGRLPPTLSLT